jgi:phage terminase large subunit
MIGQEGVSFDISTYKDNPYLSAEIVKSIEALKDINPEWWRVYGEGQIGQLEGLIIPSFELVDDMPDIETDGGLDFGFTNDPSCFLELGMTSEGLFINELFYERYLTNQDIAKKLEQLQVPPTMYIVADAAEPKSIEEIHRYGYNIVRCVKGEDSFKHGVDKVKCFKIHVTKSSVNVIKDLRNAMWDKDRDGNYINKAKKGFLHSIDAIRYAMNRHIDPPQLFKQGWIKGV